MKHLGTLCIILFTLLSGSVQAARSYTSQSALSSGHIIRVRVDHSGVYALPYDSLVAWGLQPDRVRVLGYGGAMLPENNLLAYHDDAPAVATFTYKGEDGVFGSGDCLLFYAQGPVSWRRYGTRWVHTRNPYSDYGYYFVTDNTGTPNAMTEAVAAEGEDTVAVNWYWEKMLHEKDEINLIDLTGVAGGGREFYGEVFNSSKSKRSFTFSTADVLDSVPMSCMVALAGYSTQSSSFKVTVGNKSQSVSIRTVSITDFYTMAEVDSVLVTTPTTVASNPVVSLQYHSTAPSSAGYLNYIELMVPHGLTMQGGDAVLFANASYMNEAELAKYSLGGADAKTLIWRLNDGVKVELMPTAWDGKSLTFTDHNNGSEYVAVRSSGSFPVPTRMGDVPVQNLHGLSNIDLVIITPAAWLEPAKRLARYHEQKDAITTAVVTDQQVYNEFSSGTPDVTAYRWLMKMLWDRAGGDKSKQPKNLLLFGSGSYDNRRILPLVSGTASLLQYEAINSTLETSAYACDDYCTFLEDGTGVDSYGKFNDVRATMAIGVGRLPVTTLEQANQVVDKLCTYMDNLSLGKWKTELCFLADDGDHGLHVQTADAGAERIFKKNPDFSVKKIYLDAYTQEVSASGETYPVAKNQFDNLLANGVLFMDYSGHGGYNNITNEQFLSSKTIRNMTNTNQGLWLLATCSFSHYDGSHICAAEEAVLNPYGGAIGVISACRTVYATQNTIFNRNVCDTLFGHKDLFTYNMTLGQALRMGKNNTGRDANKMAYCLLGDPALKLNYPTQYQVQTTTKLDTMHALTIQSVKGYIQSSDLDTATWFNGKVAITVLDKKQQITTKDNDEPSESSKVRITYNDYPNTLISGEADVVDGKFEFTFMVPKDIRYNYGPGRITYYARDTASMEEGVGHYEKFIVGGSSSVTIIDTVGPEIELYLNNPSFRSGDATYEFPHFYANLYDEHGINMVGTGIGHDLLLIIDNSASMTYTLNSYFKSTGSFRSGQVSYQMPQLEEGNHSLLFRAWDLLNNSSTRTLNFQVVEGLDPQIYSVSTYPNPVKASETIHLDIQYDQPDEIISTTVYVYDMTGRLLLTKEQLGTEGIAWKVGANNMSQGVYLYQVKIKTPKSSYVSKTGKIIVHQ